MATKLSKEMEKRLRNIKVNAKSEEEARKALLEILAKSGCEGMEDEDFDYILSIAEALQDETAEEPKEEGETIAEELLSEAVEETTDETEEEETVEETEGDEFDGMDRTALKKYIKTNGLAITVMKSWDDDKIREEIRSAVLTTEEPEEEPKPEPKKSAKKETKKEPAEEEPKDEPKQVKKPSKKEDSKPEKKSEKKEGGKRGEKLDPRNNIDDQKEVIAELAKTFPEKEYLYAWLNTRGVTIKHKGTNSQKGVFTFENMTRREDGEIRCSVWFLCLRKNKELLEEIMDIDTAWDGTPGKKGMTVKEAIEIFNELKDKIETSLQKSDKKLGENRVKMEENIKAGNKRNNKGK